MGYTHTHTRARMHARTHTHTHILETCMYITTISDNLATGLVCILAQIVLLETAVLM